MTLGTNESSLTFLFRQLSLRFKVHSALPRIQGRMWVAEILVWETTLHSWEWGYGSSNVMGEVLARLALGPVAENLYPCDSPGTCDRLWHEAIGRLLLFTVTGR